MCYCDIGSYLGVITAFTATSTEISDSDSELEDPIGWKGLKNSCNYRGALPLSVSLAFTRAEFDWKPVQRVQDSRYMLSFLVTNQTNSVLFIEVSSIYPGKHCQSLVLLLSRHLPSFCNHSLWDSAWYYQYYEYILMKDIPLAIRRGACVLWSYYNDITHLRGTLLL